MGGTCFSVIYNGEGHKMPILAIVGIDTVGGWEVLAFTIGERENQTAWEDSLEDLKHRGVETVDLWITDGNHAMPNAMKLKYKMATAFHNENSCLLMFYAIIRSLRFKKIPISAQ